jgi:hypothetical protein
MMTIPPVDEEYLLLKGLRWEFLQEPAGSDRLLVVRDVRLAAGKYNVDGADVLFRIPAGFPTALLDMFWVCPVLALKNGSAPAASTERVTHEGRLWQRFSRHLPDGRWRPGVDSLKTYLPLVFGELCQP